MALSSVLYRRPPRDLVMAAPLWPFFASSLHAKNVHVKNTLGYKEVVGYPLLYELLFHLHLFGDVLLVADQPVGVLIQLVHSTHQQLHVTH